MKRTLPLVWLLGCSGLTAHTPLDPIEDSPRPSDPATQPWDIAPDVPTFETPEDWTDAGETWRLDIRDGALPQMSPTLWDLPRELAMEILLEDTPTLSVRLAYVQSDSTPPEQDYCGATVVPPEGDLVPTLLGNWFSIDIGTGLDLGQAWTWRHVQITGRMDRESGKLHNGWWIGVVQADSLAKALNLGDDDACASLRDVQLECLPCVTDASQMCVVLEVPMDGTREIGFVVEPLNQNDVDANPSCLPVGPR